MFDQFELVKEVMGDLYVGDFLFMLFDWNSYSSLYYMLGRERSNLVPMKFGL